MASFMCGKVLCRIKNIVRENHANVQCRNVVIFCRKGYNGENKREESVL
jgi:hypothetical protein